MAVVMMRHRQNKYFKCKDREAKSKLLLPSIQAEQAVDKEAKAILNGEDCTLDEGWVTLAYNQYLQQKNAQQ